MDTDRTTTQDSAERVFYVVRHGQTVGNLEGRRMGHGDTALTPLGIRQSLSFADALATVIRDRSSLRMVSSPLERTRHTAGLIAERLGLAPEQCGTSPLLRELDFGHWQGLTNDEVESRFPGAQAARHEAHWSYVIPGGESYAQASRRARE